MSDVTDQERIDRLDAIALYKAADVIERRARNGMITRIMVATLRKMAYKIAAPLISDE